MPVARKEAAIRLKSEHATPPPGEALDTVMEGAATPKAEGSSEELLQVM